MTGLLVALGAGAGSAVRYLVAGRWDRRWPLGTLLVNVLGSTTAGALAGVALAGHMWALLGAGVCGGLTTWSGFAVQVHDLGLVRGAALAVATLALSVAGCVLGFAGVAALAQP